MVLGLVWDAVCGWLRPPWACFGHGPGAPGRRLGLQRGLLPRREPLLQQPAQRRHRLRVPHCSQFSPPVTARSERNSQVRDERRQCSERKKWEILDFERGVSVSELGENWRSPTWYSRRQFWISEINLNARMELAAKDHKDHKRRYLGMFLSPSGTNPEG